MGCEVWAVDYRFGVCGEDLELSVGVVVVWRVLGRLGLEEGQDFNGGKGHVVIRLGGSLSIYCILCVRFI